MSPKRLSENTTAEGPWRPDRPFNDLPPLPPACELETRTVLKQCIPARVALAALEQAAKLIPNQAMLINTIPLLEAKDSSEIENIVTTADQLFRFAQSADAAPDAATKEAARYLRGLVSIGVLREEQVGKEKLFIHPRLMQLLKSDSSDFEPFTTM